MPAALAALIADVYTITNRPDLVAETAIAVKAATLQLHRSDFFYKDLTEVALQFDSAAYLQNIEYRALFPGFRAMKYLRKYDPTSTNAETLGVGDFFKLLTPEDVLDSYKQARTDIYYLAGDLIQIKSSTSIEYCLIGVYQNPIVTEAGYNSWISDEAYYAIVYAAAANMFGAILNNPAKKAANEQLAAFELTQIKMSNITAEGF